MELLQEYGKPDEDSQHQQHQFLQLQTINSAPLVESLQV
jgi:hypothetical protein